MNAVRVTIIRTSWFRQIEINYRICLPFVYRYQCMHTVRTPYESFSLCGQRRRQQARASIASTTSRVLLSYQIEPRARSAGVGGLCALFSLPPSRVAIVASLHAPDARDFCGALVPPTTKLKFIFEHAYMHTIHALRNTGYVYS